MLRFIRPTIPEPREWLPFLADSYRQRLYSNFGPAATRLEEALAEKYGGGRRALLTANATAGLTVALQAFRVRGSVVVPAFTFPATAQAVLQAGCRPLFCDVSPRTWELDLDALAALLRGRNPIGAVIHVRSFGFCRDLGPLENLLRGRGIPLIIDAAAALGGRLDDGRWCGGQGDVEVFSLHATKVFGIGEGGVIFAPPEREAELRCVLNFGLQCRDIVLPGMNGKLSDFHAAVGLAVLARIDAFIERRTHIARRYARTFHHTAMLQLPPAAGAPSWQTFPLRLLDGSADALALRAYEKGVELRRYYAPALTDSTLFAGAASGRVETARALVRGMICLPIYSDMTDPEAGQVIDVVLRCLDELAANRPMNSAA
jgi:dTDP-4-amino-4,6-dideoxygalactose transaminase